MKLIDMACPNGHVHFDVWVSTPRSAEGAQCLTCSEAMTRTWAFVKAPGVTPQGTRPERGYDPPTQHVVDTKAIAAETKREVEDKWLRFSDERVAEEHIKREINHQAGWWDAAGNETPIPTPAPITFPKSEAMA